MSHLCRLILLVCAFGCDVEHDLGGLDGGPSGDAGDLAPSGQDAGGAGATGAAAGAGGTRGADDLVALSSCASDAPWLCQSKLTTLARFSGGGEPSESKTYVGFDADGNRYLGYRSEGVDVLASDAPDGTPRWQHGEDGVRTHFELGGGRVCTPGGAAGGELFRDRDDEPAFAWTGAMACLYTTGADRFWRNVNVAEGAAMIEDFALDARGNVYVVGQISIEGSGGDAQAFVLQLRENGDTGFVHVLGGEGRDFASTIEVDQHGLRVLGGFTTRIELSGAVLEPEPALTGPSMWLASLGFDGELSFALVPTPPEGETGGFQRGVLAADGAGGTAVAIEWSGSEQLIHIDPRGTPRDAMFERPTLLESFVALVRSADGYVLGGSCTDERNVSDVCLIWLDDQLQGVTSGRYGRPYAHGDPGKVDEFESMAVGPDGALYIGGRTSNRRDLGPLDPFVAKIEPLEPAP